MLGGYNRAFSVCQWVSGAFSACQVGITRHPVYVRGYLGPLVHARWVITGHLVNVSA